MHSSCGIAFLKLMGRDSRMRRVTLGKKADLHDLRKVGSSSSSGNKNSSSQNKEVTKVKSYLISCSREV